MLCIETIHFEPCEVTGLLVRRIFSELFPEASTETRRYRVLVASSSLPWLCFICENL